jgi:hypothetical protein
MEDPWFWPMMNAIGTMNEPPAETRIDCLLMYLRSPFPLVRQVAWQSLIGLAPNHPELQAKTIEWLADPENGPRIYLPKLLEWSGTNPALIETIQGQVHRAIQEGDPDGFWLLADRVTKLGTNGHRFAESLVQRLFANRLAPSWQFRARQDWLFYSIPEDFAAFIRDSRVDCSELLATLRASAASETNQYRFDDAQCITLLGGDSGIELNLLEQTLATAPTDIRKEKLGRYVQLVADPARAAAFLKPFLSDSETPVRRHALREVAQLGDAATNLLAEIDLMAESDRSPATRHMARRTGNVLRGLPSAAGVFEGIEALQGPP